MERAEGGLKPLTVKSLLQAYGVTDPGEIDAFLGLARGASKPGWWHSSDDVLPSWFRVAVGLEESASLICAYEPQLVPGLPQTEGYIRAITAASSPAASDEETDTARPDRPARRPSCLRPHPATSASGPPRSDHSYHLALRDSGWLSSHSRPLLVPPRPAPLQQPRRPDLRKLR
jgi:hypothetical protein